MADLTITAANVVKGANAVTKLAYALEAITAGQSLYIAADKRCGKYDADDTAKDNLVGVALNGASANQPVVYQTDGEIAIGAVVTPGVVYLGSDTAGGIRPDSDAGSGDKISILGVGKSSTTILLGINNTGIVK